jgi:type IV secretion system protein VirB10
MDAGTGINGARMSGGIPTPEGDVQQLAGLMNAMGGAGKGAGPAGGARVNPMSNNVINGASFAPRAVGGDDDGGSDQEAKRSFMAAARKGAENNYIQSTRVKSLSAFEIKAGWDIPATLEQEINSDLPGEIRALVRENVFDTASGQYLLVPQGSRLVGEYDSKIAYAQNALIVVWSRLIFPDGSSVDLEGMGSQDVRGRSGLRGDVNHHYARIFGTAALSSAFSIAAVIAQTRRQQNVFAYPSTGDIAASAAGSEIARLGAATTRRNLSIQPTITIPTGTRFSVRVHKDLMFAEPYRPYTQGPQNR